MGGPYSWVKKQLEESDQSMDWRKRENQEKKETERESSKRELIT